MTKEVKEAEFVAETDIEDAKAVPAAGGLHRGLKNRHVAMISIGGVIGTGLFLGTANALRRGGPAGLLLGYVLMGTIVWAVMISLGEMISFLPIPGGHIALANRFVDSSLSFTMGWNYFYNWAIVLPAELSAAAVLMGYWAPAKEINNGVWITIFLIVVVVINFMGSRVYGETEFWFASIKVFAIVALIITGIVIVCGGGPDHDAIGFKYWMDPGPFVEYIATGSWGKFLGFWSVLIQAAFSYIGTEVVAIAAGEAKNPRRNIPRAISRVYIRICVFYIGGVFVIGLLVPSNDPSLKLSDGTAASSPFVIGIKRAGITILPDIINACLLSSAWSAGSSDVYSASRALYGLAVGKNAPAIFAKTTKGGLPWVAVLTSSLFGLLAYMTIESNAGTVFNWFANLTSVAGLVSWIGICITYIRFHAGLKAQKIDRKTLPYVAPLQPYAAYYALIVATVVVFFNAWSAFVTNPIVVADVVTSYIAVPLFFILYFGHKYYTKSKIVKPEEMDFVSGLNEILAMEEPDKEKPKTLWGKIWSALF